MNSKEALELLKSKYKCVDTKTYRKILETIEKDLEVLDILKDNVVCKDGTTTTFDTRDEKVRGWLDNDK